ncbi:DUF418 domain-containing protein [Shewanella sp. JM162201]|uniref:DUF418 domain-containing protein n=1 Tax=Shewanella jiangmenensis TaxID=2837387 RepID=A0ABS5V404_9GAMM|nr:DUF418 domain-containing protein [Shewanella jiangmenensis]MBT1444346.1 DUF418 domain-containing protein [Shewanella jiangmenensis]
MSASYTAAPPKRSPHIDAIRGLAVLGIFLMNILFMGNTLDGYAKTSPAAPGDPLLELVSRIFFEGRFIGLFTLLFGVGLAIQFARASSAGNSEVNLEAHPAAQPNLNPIKRRLKVLMLFGLLHGLFIWPGDVLLSYGLSAMVAIYYLGAELNHLKRRAMQFLALGFSVLLVFATMLMGEELPARGTDEFIAALAPWIGSYPEQLIQHLTLMAAMNLLALPFAMLWYMAGMMMLGMWLYRSDFFSHGLSTTDTVRLLLLALALVALDLFCHAGSHPWLEAISQVTVIFAAIPVSLLYALAIIHIQRQHPNRLATLQRVGKLALSLYILQSIVGVLVFRYLFPEWLLEFNRIDYLLAALGWGLCQILIATVYLKFARQGPLEWLWRRLATGQHTRPGLATSNPSPGTDQ